MSKGSQNYLLNMIGSFRAPVGATQLVKAVFLEEAISNHAIPKYRFYRWYYGPYCKELSKDLEALVEAGDVLKERKGESLVYRSKLPSNEFTEIAGAIESGTKGSLKPFLEELYKKFDVYNMVMGQFIDFNSDVKMKADSFLRDLRNK